MLVGGAALYISNKSARREAGRGVGVRQVPRRAAEIARRTWAAGTGYVPIRKSATELPAVQDLWASEPGYKVAYDQLVTGVNNARPRDR